MGKVVLSLDGGGIRGAATTQFLSRLDELLMGAYDGPSLERIDPESGKLVEVSSSGAGAGGE